MVRSASRSVLFPLLTLALGLAVALLLGEGLMRWLRPQNLSGTWRVQTPRGYPVNKPGGTARHQFGDTVVVYRFNEHHLRGAPVAEAGRRVLVLGDSFTFGWLVEEADSVPGRLQSLADAAFGAGAFQFLNGGTGGWGTAEQLAFLEDFSAALRPDIVLVLLNSDDIARSARSGLYRLAGGAVPTLEVLPGRPHDSVKTFMNRLPLYAYLLEHSHLFQFLRSRFIGLRQRAITARRADTPAGEILLPGSARPADETDEPYARLGQALYLRMKAWCDRHGARLLVVTTGWHFNMGDGIGPDREPTRAFLRQAQRFFEKENIPFEDLTPDVEPVVTGDRHRYIGGDWHPSAAGSRLIADHVWSWLRPRLAEAPARAGSD